MDALAHRPMTIPNPPMLPISAAAFPITISGDMSMSSAAGPSISTTTTATATTTSNSATASTKMRLAAHAHGMDVSHSAQEELGLALPPPPGYGYHSSAVSVPSSYRSSAHYPPYFPVSPPPPRPFLPDSSFEYHPRTHFHPMNYPPTRSLAPYHQHPDPYIRLTAQQYHHHHHHHQQGQQQQQRFPPMMYPSQAQTAQQQQQQAHPNANDIFAGFLDGDPRPPHAGAGFAPMDWPVHGGMPGGRAEPGTSVPLLSLIPQFIQSCFVSFHFVSFWLHGQAIQTTHPHPHQHPHGSTSYPTTPLRTYPCLSLLPPAARVPAGACRASGTSPHLHRPHTHTHTHHRMWERIGRRRQARRGPPRRRGERVSGPGLIRGWMILIGWMGRRGGRGMWWVMLR
jgi:hypothetical protein